MIQKSQEDIYKKLHKVKFDGLFKKEYDKDQINEEIKKILAPITDEKKEKKTMGKAKYNINNNEIKANNDYPFIHEKFTCFIF